MSIFELDFRDRGSPTDSGQDGQQRRGDENNYCVSNDFAARRARKIGERTRTDRTVDDRRRIHDESNGNGGVQRRRQSSVGRFAAVLSPHAPPAAAVSSEASRY